MINRTYRTLNEPARLIGFSAWQWLALLTTVLVTFGTVKLLGLGVRPALTIMALSLSVVIAIALAQEPGSVAPLTLLADHVRFLIQAKRFGTDGDSDASPRFQIAGERS